MIYGSVCSGIEAATVAWHPLGWHPAFFSEIDPFPRAVLAHHYPTVPLHGDFTTIQPGDYAAIDLLVGGTPCQSFSVAGLRGGLADERGNLALEYLRLADRLRPRWLVWENVPGVLSSSGGRDFGAFLGGLVELGYGFAYRVLDAQYFGLAQRRKRVFVVGHLGDWRPASAALFPQFDGLRGHPAPRREARKGAAAGTARSVALRGREGGATAELGDDCGLTLRASGGGGDKPHALIAPELARCDATREGSSQDWETTTMVAHSLRAEGFDASEDGTGRGTPLVPVGVDLYNQSVTGDVAATLSTTGGGPLSGPSLMSPIAFHPTQDPISSEGVVHALGTGSAQGCATAAVAFDVAQITSRTNRSRAEPGLPAGTLQKESRMHVASQMQVRRLTPLECCRLQGFPDTYLDITYRGKPAADGPKYKALGNSMAVPVMAWIGRRIQAADDELAALAVGEAA